MAKEQEQYNVEVSDTSMGLCLDTLPNEQPKGTVRFALNAINETKQGRKGKLSNEQGNRICTSLTSAGFVIIGDTYIEDNTSLLLCKNPNTGLEEIGILDKNDIYTTIVSTQIIGLTVEHQCDVIYRLRRGNEKVVYWTDGNTFAKTFSITKPYNFYNDTYNFYIRTGGNPATFIGEKWDTNSFNLVKTYNKIPTFDNVEIVDNGNTASGSYNFAIQLVDQDLNPTGWITTSNVVRIYDDSTTNSYETIRGSRNIPNTNQNFPRANKSIKLTIGNLDTSYPYYRVAIITANLGTGQATGALLSELFSTANSNFIYSGNDDELSSIALSDILVENTIIYAPHHIDQLENRLILSNGADKDINWCNYQQYASKIRGDLVYKSVILNNVLSEPNIKNPKSTFQFKGYMPGDVASFGIMYLMDDYTLSPTFHIPGTPVGDSTSLLRSYELNTKYIDVHSCSTNNYWGKDYQGNTIVGKPVRHFRFPFRHDVQKPLFTRTTNSSTINQYLLTITITLNPAWVSQTSQPNFFPTNNGTPIVIGTTIQYRGTGQPNIQQFNTNITNTDIGNAITVYKDVNTLDAISGSNHFILDPSSQLASYQNVGGANYYGVPRFILTESYTSSILSSSNNSDIADIFGISFSNIECPPNAIGFYIVRNERKDDDKLVVDNAIFGPSITYNNYKSFGLIMPKQYNTNKIAYEPKAAWFFNPAFEYLGKKQDFSSVQIEGYYNESAVQLPTIQNQGIGGPSLGLYIQDVQAGTSYNSSVNTGSDNDGFDLLVGYRNTDTVYNTNTSADIFPTKDKVFYLNAASYQNNNNDIFYNVSTDNKIGFFLSQTNFNIPSFYNSSTNRNGIIYGAMTRNSQTCYSDFITRPYYKEHNNPILFNGLNVINNIQIFNGDAEISVFNFVSSVLYDIVVASRSKKSGLFNIILGALLVVAAVVATVLSAGAATPAAVAALGAASSLALSLGLAQLQVGLKQESLAAMWTVDYAKGLKETITDGGVYNTIRESLDTSDDTIRWFVDRLSNIYIESSVPFGLRSGLTSGVPDFTNAPVSYAEESFRNYLTEKLTVIDRDQGSGRLYRGFASSEVYDMNLDYIRFNKEKVFIHLPLEYDCCNNQENLFPDRVWYSQQSFQEEKTDNYRTFLPNNYRDIEGEHGEITDTYVMNNSLYIHTKEAVYHLPQNLQERVTGDLVASIGTGEFFSIPPRKILDDKLGSGGTQHKWATIKTPFGVFFVNEVEGKVYINTGQVTEVSSKGLENWFKENLKNNLNQDLYSKFNQNFLHNNNPANQDGTGYLASFDTRYRRILLTKKDYSILPDKLAILQLVNTKLTSGNAFVYAIDDGYFYLGVNRLHLDDQTYFENKSWTLSYSFYNSKFPWVSWHNYLPNYYIYKQNSLYSTNSFSYNIYKHNIDGLYQTYYGIRCPFIIDYPAYTGIVDKIFESLTLQTIASKYDTNTKIDVEQRMVTFNKITAYNNRQCTNRQIIVPKVPVSSWFGQQVTNVVGQILAARNESNWNLNSFRDMVTDYTIPFFSKNWNDIKQNYYIDKVLNTNALATYKPWYNLESLRDKYVSIRLEFDNYDDISLTLDFSMELEQISER